MNSDKWAATKALLKSKLTSAMYTKHFSRSTAILGDRGLIVSLNHNSLDMVRNRLHEVVKDSVSRIYGDVVISYQAQLPGVPDLPESVDTFRVEDKRKRPPFFMVDNDLVRGGHSAKMRPFAFAVYIALCLHVNKDSECWPSYQTLADLTGQSRRSAIRQVNRLIELGYIAVSHISDNGRFTSNTITLLDYLDL